MSKKQLLDALEHLDEELLEEHFLMKERLKMRAPVKKAVHKSRILLACAVMALCLFFIFAGAFALLSRDPSPPDPLPPESGTVSDRHSSGAQKSPLSDSTSSPLDVPESGEPIPENSPTPSPEPPLSFEELSFNDIEPAEKYSTAFLEWLVNIDRGTRYPMVYSGGLYAGMRYNHNTDMEPSAFALWPYDEEQQEVSHNTHFHLCLYMDSSEFDGTPNIGTEDYPYKWVVYYREIDSTGDYEKFEGAPWSAVTYGDCYFYRFDVYSAGFRPQLKEDGSTNAYHMIFLIFNQKEELVIWRDEIVDWTDSSEAYLQDAIKHGIVSPERYERLSARWLTWLTTEDQGKTYHHAASAKALDGVSYASGYDASPFEIRPYEKESKTVFKDSRFGFNLLIDQKEFPNGKPNSKRYWDVFYRSDPNEQYKRISCKPLKIETYDEDSYLFQFDLYSAGMTDLSLTEKGDANNYEMIFVLFQQEDHDLWAEVSAQFTLSSQAYLDDARALGLVSKAPEKTKHSGLFSPDAWIKLHDDPDYEYTCSLADNAELLNDPQNTHIPLFRIENIIEFEHFKKQFAHLIGPPYKEYSEFHIFQNVCSAANEAFFQENDLILLYPASKINTVYEDTAGAFLVRDEKVLIILSALSAPVNCGEPASRYLIAIALPKSSTQGCSTFDALDMRIQ